MAMLRTDIEFSMLPQLGTRPVRWRIADDLVPYEEAVETMEREVAVISDGGDELVWLVEHPPLYTAGTSANKRDL
ncbi:lipoyl(octanoyl) transferase LipB, partial [Rhizobium ruizarguesonis]